MPDNNARPLGRLFSEVYRDRGDPVDDDPRFRVQVLAVLERLIGYKAHGDLAAIIMGRLGIEVPSFNGVQGPVYDFDRWIKECGKDDLFDAITLVARYLHGQALQKTWIEGISAALDRRNLKYEVDSQGGMHYRIDAAFQHSKGLTLAGLVGAEFTAAHDELEKAFGYLTQVNPDTKMATVNTFLAAENVFKLVADTKADLDEGEVNKTLMPLVQKLYASCEDATKQSSSRLVSSFAKWVSACHPYRHGHNELEQVAPPTEIAITLVTTGTDFIRWLVELQRLKLTPG